MGTEDPHRSGRVRRGFGALSLPGRRVAGMTGSMTAAGPAAFRRAVARLDVARLRTEIELGPLPAPARLAPYSHALSATVYPPGATRSRHPAGSCCSTTPTGSPAWGGELRIVAFATCELDTEIAQDPLLPEVAWSWLTESLDASGAGYTALGGTVTATSSTRFGDIAGPHRADDLELRASWTADENTDLHLAGVRRLPRRGSRASARRRHTTSKGRSVRGAHGPIRYVTVGRNGCLTTDGRRADTMGDNGTSYPTGPSRSFDSTVRRRTRTIGMPRGCWNAEGLRGRVGGRPVSNASAARRARIRGDPGLGSKYRPRSGRAGHPAADPAFSRCGSCRATACGRPPSCSSIPTAPPGSH